MSEARFERRLAAVLAVDVDGYSRLMGADEEGTLVALRAVRRDLGDPKIAEHRGRIVKTTGDGLLVEFASVVDAVRCAVEVQREMLARNAAAPAERRVEFRMGINLGDIIIEDGDIFGDGVNIAARLEALAEPGGICLSAAAHEQLHGRLECAFADLGEHRLRNIARPIRVYRVEPKTAPEERAGTTGAALALPDKPSIAVLPFQNMTGDPEQEYFVDGVVEEIITALSRLHWLFVIARNSSFTYKEKAVDVKQVGRELGVRYILEGSVRKARGRVRITGQLIDTKTGVHIWADRFDGALDDIFELQDQVAGSVVGVIEPKLRHSEIERASRKPTERLDAYDLYLRALAQFYRYSEERMREAIALLRQALVIDPSYAPAAALIGWCWGFQRVQDWGPVPAAEVAEAVRLAGLAIEVGKDDPDALWMAGNTLSFFAGEHASGASAIDRALTLNPNSAHAWMGKGLVSYRQNRPDVAIDAFKRALRLSPLDPLGYIFMCGLALAHVIARRYEEAIEWADRSLRDAPRFESALRNKVVSCAHLGRVEEVRNEIARLLELQPELTIASFKARYEVTLPPEILDIYVEGYSKAGLPEK
jgi:adenylate cyclase